MSERLIEVGLSTIRGLGREGSFDEAAKQLIRNALHTTNLRDLQLRCVLLLATADWCQPSNSISAKIRSHLKKNIGYEVPIIGSSVAGFYCSTDPEPVVKQGLLLLALCSNNLWVTVNYLKEPYTGSKEDRKRRLSEMAKDVERKAGTKLGASADRSLFGFLPGVISQNGCRAYFDNELHEEILSVFNHKYPLVGASAANGMEPYCGYQFADDECLESGLAVAIVESDLAIAAMMGHGFTPSSKVRVSVDELADGAESGYVVTQFDGKAAIERLHELDTEGKAKMGRPIFGLPCGDDFNIIWPHEKCEKESTAISLKRKVARGDKLYILDALPDQMMRSAEDTLKSVLDRTGAKVKDLGFILGFSCAGRSKYYDSQNSDWTKAIDRIRESYLGIPLVWALSAGEFGLDQWRRIRSNNMSMSIAVVMNTYSQRARTRSLQGDLLNAANGLAISDSPMKVMKAALDGAIDVGACGGQICIVDPQIHRIIGIGYGFATQFQQSTHNWTAIAKITDREAPKSIGGTFPSYLKDWAMPVVSDTPLRLDFSSIPPDPSHEEYEDILTLIVRTHQAIFVPDSKDPKFHCDQTAIEAGDISCQLAVPLIGSRGKAIATLQLSFPDKTNLDRESFSLWVGYAQKVAAALERTQETEERGIMEEISSLGKSIMDKSVEVQGTPYDWCNEYIRKVTELVGADGGHMRVLAENNGIYQYELTGVFGYMADVLPFTRQIIKEGDGSYNMNVLSRGGWITNTLEETVAFNHAVKAIENPKRYSRLLGRRLAEIESQAIFPLYDQKQVLGSFVLYSKHRYLFTERRVRIARAAAAIAGAIFRAKKIDYERAKLDSEASRLDIERTWILDSLISVSGGTAEERLHSLITHICLEVYADVASVYVWYETPRKLILHTSHNWNRPMEGKANYQLGEGWTGSIALNKDTSNLTLNNEEVTIVTADSPNSSLCIKKYYNEMVPEEHQVEDNKFDTRIGIRLSADGRLVGVVTFLYYSEHSYDLPSKTDHIINYLKTVTRLITLGVEAAKQEAAQNRTQELFNVKNEVAAQLIQSPNHVQGWHPIAEKMVKGFNVERVTFYNVRPDKKIEIDWFAQSSDCSAHVKPIIPSEPYGDLGDLVYYKKPEVFIFNPDDTHINQWPNNRGIKSLYAVPVVTTRGDISGVLEFVNRKETADHPFGYFDKFERNAALDVARYLAAAIEERDHERALNELTSKLTTAMRIAASGLFGAIVMHHVMTPFSNIRISIDWLLRNPNSSIEDRNKYLRRIEANCSRAVQIIEEASHRGTLGRRQVKLQEVIEQAIRAMEPELPAPGVKLNLKRTDDSQDIIVNVNLWSIVNALVNLLSNAIDAMKGSGVITISTRLDKEEGNAIISIHNTGPSLTDQQIVQLFEPGFSTKPVVEGHLGFGLPLAKQAVEGVGGTIHMNSPVNGGVEAIITLPVINAPRLTQLVKE